MADNEFTIPSINEVNQSLQNDQEQSQQNQAAAIARLKAARQEAQATREAYDRRFYDNEKRTGSEALQDSGLAIANSVIALGQMAYGVADMESRTAKNKARIADIGLNALYGETGEAISDFFGLSDKKTLDETTQGSQQFGKAREYVNQFKSNPLKADQRQIQEESVKRESNKEERIANLRNTLAQSVLGKVGNLLSDETKEQLLNVDAVTGNFIGDTVDAVGDYIDNPIAAYDAALESTASLVAGGGVGRLAQASVIKGMTAKEAKDFLATEAGQKAIKDAGEKAAIGFTAASEGFSNAVDAKAEVLNINQEQLFMDSPVYREYLNQGIPEDEARQMVADNVFDTVLALTSVAGGVTSKLSGAAKLEGNLFNPNSKGLSIVTDAIGGTVKEGVEEAAQGASGQLATNYAIRENADDTRELDKGLSDNVAASLVAGGLTGATVGTTPAVLSAVQEAADDTVARVNDATKTSRVEKAIKKNPEAVKELTNVEAKDYDPETAIIATVSQEDFAAPEKLSENIANVEVHLQKMYESAMTKLNNVDALKEAGKTKEAEIAEREAVKEAKLTEKYLEHKEALQKAAKPTTEEIGKLVAEIKETGNTEQVERVLASSPSVEQAEQLAQVKGLDDATRTNVENYVATQKEFNRLKDLNTVSQEVLFGGKSKDGIYRKGIKNFQDTIRNGVAGSNEEVARTELADFNRFTQEHTAKAALYRQALNDALAGNKDTPAIKQVKQEYGNTIHRKSGRLVQAVEQEAALLQTGLNESEQLINSKFGVPESNAQPVSTETQANAPVQEENVTEAVTEPLEENAVNAPVEDAQTAEPTTNGINPEQAADAAIESNPEATQEAQTNSVEQTPVPSVETLQNASQEESAATKQLRERFNKYSEGELQSIISTDMEVNGELTERGAMAYDIIESRQGKKARQEIIDRSPNLKGKYEVNRKTFRGVTEDLGVSEGLVAETDQNALEQLVSYNDDFTKRLEDALKQFGSNLSIKATGLVPVFNLFMDEQGNLDIPKEVSDSMSIAAFDFFANEARSAIFHTEQTVESLLGNKNGMPLGKSYMDLARIGLPHKQMATELGRKVLKVLGIKPGDHVGEDLELKLPLSIGELIMDVMQRQGLVEYIQIPTTELAEYMEAPPENIDPRSMHTYVRPMTANVETKYGIREALVRGAHLIENAARQSDILDKLYGLPKRKVFPRLTKPKSVRKQVSDGSRDVPEAIRQIEIKHSQRANNFKMDKMGVILGMDAKNLLRLAGGRTDFDKMMPSQAKKQEAVNKALENQLQNMMEFYESLEDPRNAEFYLTHYAASNQRMHIEGLIDPQQSKLMRHLLGLKSFDTTVSKEDKALYKQYRLALAEAFDLDPDKKFYSQTERELNKFLAKSEIQAGIDATVRMLQGEQQDGDQEAIVAAVDAGGMAMHSFDGLVALAKERMADGQPFETSLFREVDGITNGVAIGLTQLKNGDANKLRNMLARAGVFIQTDMTDYADYISRPGNFDSYQTLALNWADALKEIKTALATGRGSTKFDKTLGNLSHIKDVHKKIIALETLLKGFMDDKGQDGAQATVSKLARSFSKNPLMITNYGAGIKKVIDEFANEVVAKIYKDFNDALNENDIAAQQKINEDLSTITGQKVTLSRNRELSESQHKRLVNLVSTYYGEALETAIKAEFGDFIENRKALNDAMNYSFYVFKAFYENSIARREGRTGRKVTAAEKEYIFEELKQLHPVLATFYGHTQDDGILVMKDKSRALTGDRQIDKPYRVEARFSSPKPINLYNPNTGDVTDKTIKSIATYPDIREYTDAGVAGAIMGIHSTDAATMYGVIDNYAGLNVHDAIGFSLKDVESGTRAFNKSFHDVTFGYSLAESTKAMYDKANAALSKANENVNRRFDKLVKESKSFAYSGMENLDEYVTSIGTKLNATVAGAQEVRNWLKENITAINQYNMGDTGGAFLTDNYSMVVKQEATMDALTDALGSSDANFDNFNPSIDTEVNKLNSKRIYEMLAKTGNVKDTPEHKEALDNVYHNLVTKVIEPFQLKVQRDGAETIGRTSQGKVEIIIGSGGLVNGTQMSSQETYVHELVHMVTRTGIDKMGIYSDELVKLFKEAEKVVRPEDFLNVRGGQILDKNGAVITPQSPNYAEELAAATERYNYIFKNTGTHGNRNNYLHEFMAFGLTNEGLRNRLAQIDAGGLPARTRYKQGKNLLERMWNWFTGVLDYLSAKATGTQKMTADKKLFSLAVSLAALEDQNRDGFYGAYEQFNGKIEEGIRRVVNWTIEPLSKVASIVEPVKGIGAAVKMTRTGAKVGFETYRKALKKTAKRAGLSEDSIVTAMATELHGRTDRATKWHALGRISNRFVDQLRQARSRNTINQLMAHFVSDTEMSGQEKEALGRVALKGDLQALKDDYSLQNIADIVNPEKNTAQLTLAQEIAKLSQFKDESNYYRKMALSLGHLMATGKALEHETKLNAYVIANLIETGREAPEHAEKARPIIDRIATIYAISNMDVETRKNAHMVIQREINTGSSDNGISFLLNSHRAYIEDSRDSLFNGSEMTMVKGYTKEIFNPRVTYEVGYLEDEAEYLERGFVRLEEAISKDPLDANQEEKYLYVNKNGVRKTWMAGITSLTSRKAKGTDLVEIATQDGFTSENIKRGNDESLDMYKAKQERMEGLFSADSTSIDPSEVNLTVPLIDENGDTRGYRYMMSEHTKKTVFEKIDDFTQVMGAMEASIVDKVNTVEVNKQVVHTAFEEYRNDYTKNPENFVRVGLDSSNPKYREIYQQLPKEMRMEIERVWGGDGMYVPDTLVPLIFGQRKLGLGAIGDNAFQNSKNEVLKMFGKELGKFLNKPGVQKFDEIWQEFVRLVKDVIVIRSGVVMVGNIISNLVLLANKGVNPATVLKSHYKGYTYAKRYQADFDTVEQANKELAINPNDKDAALRKARALENMERNPIKDLVDAGVYQSIVEDVELVDDSYSYASAIEEWASPFTNRIPKSIRTAAKYVTFSQDTAVYKFLRDTTQLSDFVARYTLHEHNLSKGMSKEDSINDAVDTFVNYDLPTHPVIQYLNDIGLVMFSKFGMRIQRVILDLIVNHPGRTLSIFTLQHALGDITDIVDSAANNPFGNNNLNPLDVADGLLTLPVVELAQ